MPDIYVYLYILHITYYILILHINIDINIPAIKMLSTPTVSVSTIQPIGMRQMRDIKLPQMGLELARLLTTRHKFVCFDVTSRVGIDCARSFLCQARQLSRESIGTETRGSWARIPRETGFISRIEKPQYNMNIIYIT